MDYVNNVKIAKQEIKCTFVVISATDTAIAFPNYKDWRPHGQCSPRPKEGRDQVLHHHQLRWHSHFPQRRLARLQVSKKAIAVVATVTGHYEGGVPFILDINLNFNSDGTMDFDNNVKAAKSMIHGFTALTSRRPC